MKKFFIIILCFVCFLGCEAKHNSSVNYVEAKEKIINESAILVDVRTEEEYNEGHIDGAILLPLDSIDNDSSEKLIGDKNTVIIVYCKSGKRSAQALEKLTELGYKEVYDLGAMSNWKE